MKRIAALLLLAVFLTGCGTTGTLVMQITDAPTDLNIEKVDVTISGVQVHAAEREETEGSWITVVDQPQTFDLIAIKDIKEFLGETQLQPGKYTQIRLSVDKAVATIDGAEQELEISSNTIKLVSNFDITANEETKITLDFDAMESIREAGKESYKMQPTIKVIQE